jgi:hypothetical protein
MRTVNIFKPSVVSVLLNGFESWIFDESMVSKINSFATSCYRIMLSTPTNDKCIGSGKHYGATPMNREPARIFALYESAPSHGKDQQKK